MSRREPTTGANRRRYEAMAMVRSRDPLRATIHAIERAIVQCGARGVSIDHDGPGTVVVRAGQPDGGIVGGRATVAEHGNYAIAIMYAGAACIRAVIENRQVTA